MAIRSSDDLARISEQAGALLQQIQDYCKANDLNWATCAEAQVPFPHGWIRTADHQRGRLPFVEDGVLKDNVAYTLILSDVVLWLVLRTDLWGVPRDMLSKLFLFLIGAVCESLTKEFLVGACGKSAFRDRTKYMCRHGIITTDLQADLDWLWDTRNRMHLFKLKKREYENDYTDDSHQRCILTFRRLLDALSLSSRPQPRNPKRAAMRGAN